MGTDTAGRAFSALELPITCQHRHTGVSDRLRMCSCIDYALASVKTSLSSRGMKTEKGVERTLSVKCTRENPAFFFSLFFHLCFRETASSALTLVNIGVLLFFSFFLSNRVSFIYKPDVHFRFTFLSCV